MRAQDHEHDRDDSLRPKAARIDAPESDARLRAALSGRLDVATPDTLLRVQRAAGNAGASALVQREEASAVGDVVSSGGHPLDPDVRADMEGRLGHDFGDVRVHTDDGAHRSAQAVNAKAYTVGSHVVFQRSQYDPASDAGRMTLAHELTHVVQQRSGPVEGTDHGNGLRVSDPSDRFEREAVANAERAVGGGPAPAPVTAAPAAVQRLADDDAAPAVPFVQRAEEEEKEEEKPA
ncbi:MAG TPA: DUF4157 domain-containing protein [Mycobacteriales bacterium]|jgi:hypothetical protein|nr:DUF4157 domain-containing protein [Mycobacteriales bacterium]